MPKYKILHPTVRNIGNARSVPPTFFAVGKCRGGITKIQGRIQATKPAGLLGAWVAGIVHNGDYWTILFNTGSVTPTECVLEVQGAIGAGPWHQSVRVPRFAISPPHKGAPLISYPPNDDPYVIEGSEESYFVTYGTVAAGATINQPVIVNGAGQMVDSASDWETQAPDWYAIFEDLSALSSGELQVSCTPPAPAALTARTVVIVTQPNNGGT